MKYYTKKSEKEHEERMKELLKNLEEQKKNLEASEQEKIQNGAEKLLEKETGETKATEVSENQVKQGELKKELREELEQELRKDLESNKDKVKKEFEGQDPEEVLENGRKMSTDSQ